VKVRIESTSRWDALALTRSLVRYRWYLVEPDGRHFDVCVPVEQASEELPEELRRTVETWLDERHLERTIIHQGAEKYVVGHWDARDRRRQTDACGGE
jgi:hypothetical protein